MLLNNGKNSLLIPITNANGAGSMYFKNILGEMFNYSAYGGAYYFMNQYATEQSVCTSYPVFGIGTTEVKETDYCLESPIDTLTIKSVTPTIVKSSSTNEKGELYVNVIVENTTTTNVKVSEMGFQYFYNDKTVLWYREVFDEITIAPNESKTFIVRIL